MPRWPIDSLASGVPVFLVMDAVVKATILLCLTTAVVGFLRRSSAAVRHRLWSLALCGLIVVPFLSWVLPGWRLPILPSTIGVPGSRAPSNGGTAELGSDPTMNGGSPDGIPRAQLNVARGPARPTQASPPSHTADSSGTSSRKSSVVRFFVAAGAGLRKPARLMLIWVLGLIAVALPALAGVVGNEWRRRQSRRVVDQNWLRLLDALAGQLALRRRIELRASPAPLIPMTWGVLRPVVLLPEQAEQWPEPARRLVLLHELAHIKRWDVGFQLIGRLATAIYWFHPLAWYALHRLRAECECACDDYVVHLGARRTDYARQLVELARSLRAARLSAAVPVTRTNTLEQRIKDLFDDGRSHQLMGSRPATRLLAGALVLMTGLAAIRTGTSGGEPFGIRAAAAPAATSQVQDKPKTVTPAAVAPAAEKSPVAISEESLPATFTHPITMSGRALDPAGKPISGARVYLASLSPGYKRIAETTTDTAGRYEFHNMPLPIERANTVSGRDTGWFQVFGEAQGFGFAWRPQKSFFPQPKPANITYEPEYRDPPGRYEANDNIVLDLNFPRAARLSGTIVDDRGNLLADARLEIRDCESLKVVDDVIPGWTFDTLNQRDSAPPSMKIRTTDAQGRFEFTGLPVNCRFRIDLRAKGFPDRWLYAATTREPLPEHDGFPVLIGDFRVTLATPLNVPFKIVFGDTGGPASKVAVSAGSGLATTLETTDDQGRVTLRIPPGTYRTQYLPARGTPYLITEGQLTVGAKPPDEPVVGALPPAAIIEVTVVDADTGAGIPNVDLWRQSGPNGRRELPYFRSWEVATRIAWVERPRTDARGKLRTLIEPGTHRIGVGFQSYPLSHAVVESTGQQVECRAGETVQLKFTMRKRPSSGRTMRIRVLGPDDEPLAGAKIFANVTTTEPKIINRDYICNSNGQAEVALPDASVEMLRLWASKGGYVTWHAHWWSKVQVDGHVLPAEYTFHLDKGTRIGSVVKNESGDPIAGVKVQVQLVQPAAVVHIDPRKNQRAFADMSLAQGEHSKTTDAQGRWSLDDVPPGDNVEFTLMLTHPDYVSDYSWEGLRQNEQHITTRSLRDRDATIVMHRGISVTGFVLSADGNRIEDAIVMWGDDPHANAPSASQQTRTDATGHYRLPPLPRGPLTVTVVAKDWAPAQQTLQISPEISSASFRLQSGKLLRIRFVDEAGGAIPGVSVTTERWRGGMTLYNRGMPDIFDPKIPRGADRQGIYEWNWAPEDPVTFAFFKEGFQPLRDRSLAAGQGEHVITLRR